MLYNIQEDTYTNALCIWYCKGSDRRDLVPPSHFVATTQFARPPGVVQNPTTTQTPTSWMNSGLTSIDQSPLSPWLAISQAQQEILELRKENQRIMMLQKDGTRGRIPVDPSSDHRMRYPNMHFYMKNCIIVCQLTGMGTEIVPLSQTQMWRGKWAMVWVGVRVASWGIEAQDRSQEV